MSDYRAWPEAAKDEGRMCKERPGSEERQSVSAIIIIIIIIITHITSIVHIIIISFYVSAVMFTGVISLWEY